MWKKRISAANRYRVGGRCLRVCPICSCTVCRLGSNAADRPVRDAGQDRVLRRTHLLPVGRRHRAAYAAGRWSEARALDNDLRSRLGRQRSSANPKRPAGGACVSDSEAPITVGTVLVRAGGTLSVLLPRANYPGNMADEPQWIAGQRLVAEEGDSPHLPERPEGCFAQMGTVPLFPSDEPAEAEDYAVWVFPPGTKTRALRFTHTAQPTDSSYSGWLGGAYVLPERMANVALAAICTRETPTTRLRARSTTSRTTAVVGLGQRCQGRFAGRLRPASCPRRARLARTGPRRGACGVGRRVRRCRRADLSGAG